MECDRAWETDYVESFNSTLSNELMGYETRYTLTAAPS